MKSVRSAKRTGACTINACARDALAFVLCNYFTLRERLRAVLALGSPELARDQRLWASLDFDGAESVLSREELRWVASMAGNSLASLDLAGVSVYDSGGGFFPAFFTPSADEVVFALKTASPEASSLTSLYAVRRAGPPAKLPSAISASRVWVAGYGESFRHGGVLEDLPLTFKFGDLQSLQKACPRLRRGDVEVECCMHQLSACFATLPGVTKRIFVEFPRTPATTKHLAGLADITGANVASLDFNTSRVGGAALDASVYDLAKTLLVNNPALERVSVSFTDSSTQSINLAHPAFQASRCALAWGEGVRVTRADVNL